MAQEKSCPNCGAALPRILAHARMVNCEFCESSIVLEDEAVALAGEAGVMLETPQLIALGKTVELGKSGIFTPIGHVRYDYGRGHWDEYHGQTMSGDRFWVSVDEGDVVVQQPLDKADWPDAYGAFELGAKVKVKNKTYVATELETATCLAFRGQLPEPIAVGDTHNYANYTGPSGAILSGEHWDGGAAWYLGKWIDPWMVRPA